MKIATLILNKVCAVVKEGKGYPASYVSREDAVAFCKKLTEEQRRAGLLPVGWEYRLPTEA